MSGINGINRGMAAMLFITTPASPLLGVLFSVALCRISAPAVRARPTRPSASLDLGNLRISKYEHGA